MRLFSYEYQDTNGPGWKFSPIEFGKINLLVGDSATGKTRVLNTIFNLGRFVASKEFKSGYWNIKFQHKEQVYRWILESFEKDEDQIISQEKLFLVDNEEKEVPIVLRDKDKFIFMSNELPKLSPDETSISMLKEEKIIRPVFNAFSNIKKRRFFHDALQKVSEYQPIPPKVIDKMESNKDKLKLFNFDLNLNVNLYFLSKYFKNDFNEIRDYFKKIFPFVNEVSILDFSKVFQKIALPGYTPIFCIKEKTSKEWIPISELSSGMQKVLLILTDIYLMPSDSIYIIDEYENSLGLSAIEFLPTFLLDHENDIQFFITSHHPYMINTIPVKDWYVFHRKGTDVKVKFGQELVDKFSKSKQQAFIQLINDPFYVEGVE